MMKTKQNENKRVKTEMHILKYNPRITHGGHCKFQRNAIDGLLHFLEFVNCHLNHIFFQHKKVLTLHKML